MNWGIQPAIPTLGDWPWRVLQILLNWRRVQPA